DHGSTFGGNPLGCAVSKTALEVLTDEHLVEKSFEMGAYLMDKLKNLNNDKVKEVRGKGLLIGIELHIKARPICEKLKELGMLCKDTHGTIIRLTPPLVISKDEIDWAVEQIKEALS
ncbi:MAG: aminotransferase class III-fold pyridoxal phosphate-dependent enzyme, partial [Candidatus Sericytochromatia bacterium]|nr:aminotransferase class III-fold pyridoxal phosphate-dependent enzyme [Candidatus Sericytochromatia bacterium]